MPHRGSCARKSPCRRSLPRRRHCGLSRAQSSPCVVLLLTQISALNVTASYRSAPDTEIISTSGRGHYPRRPRCSRGPLGCLSGPKFLHSAGTHGAASARREQQVAPAPGTITSRRTRGGRPAGGATTGAQHTPAWAGPVPRPPGPASAATAVSPLVRTRFTAGSAVAGLDEATRGQGRRAAPRIGALRARGPGCRLTIFNGWGYKLAR